MTARQSLLDVRRTTVRTGLRPCCVVLCCAVLCYHEWTRLVFCFGNHQMAGWLEKVKGHLTLWSCQMSLFHDAVPRLRTVGSSVASASSAPYDAAAVRPHCCPKQAKGASRLEPVVVPCPGILGIGTEDGQVYFKAKEPACDISCS